jgi:hypothetical protein
MRVCASRYGFARVADIRTSSRFAWAVRPWCDLGRAGGLASWRQTEKGPRSRRLVVISTMGEAIGVRVRSGTLLEPAGFLSASALSCAAARARAGRRRTVWDRGSTSFEATARR